MTMIMMKLIRMKMIRGHPCRMSISWGREGASNDADKKWKGEREKV